MGAPGARAFAAATLLALAAWAAWAGAVAESPGNTPAASDTVPAAATRAGTVAEHARLTAAPPAGRVVAERNAPTGTSAAELQPTREPDGRIAGRLVDRAGRGLPGFHVEALQVPDAERSPRARAPQAHAVRHATVTDASGAFELEGLRSAAADLVAHGPRHSAEREWPLTGGLDPANRETTNYTLPLVRLRLRALLGPGEARSLYVTNSNWAPAGTSALTYEALGSGWIWEASGGPAQLLVEAGHDYRLTLTGWDHATLVQVVSVPDQTDELELTLRPDPGEPPVPVEFALDDRRGFVGEDFRWNLSALRNELHIQIELAQPSSAVIWTELPPGTYDIGIEFHATEHAKHSPEAHATGSSPELLDGTWRSSYRIEVKGAAEAQGVQSFVLEAARASPPFPPGLVGPGDY